MQTDRIMTSLGLMFVSSLHKKEFVSNDGLHEIIEYWFNGQRVHRSSVVKLKGVVSEATAQGF